jgi:hypothetical protein
MARFIIADLTDPSSIPKELEAIVPGLAVPVQPLLEGSARPYAMFKDYWKYEWVLPVYRYEGLEPLLLTLADKVIAPCGSEGESLGRAATQGARSDGAAIDFTARRRGDRIEISQRKTIGRSRADRCSSVSGRR